MLAAAYGGVQGEHGLEEGVGAPEAGEFVDEPGGWGQEPGAAAEEVAKQEARGRFAWEGVGAEGFKEGVGATGSEGAAAGLAEVGGVDVFGEGIGEEGEAEVFEKLEPITQLDVLHQCGLEAFVEGVAAEEVGFEGEVAGVEVSPVGGAAVEEGVVVELEAVIEPTHEGGDGLFGLAPAGEAEGGEAG